MTASDSRNAERGAAAHSPPRGLFREGARYFAASAVALCADALVYVALIRLLDVHYLAAAPAGFILGISVHYALSTRWVFRERRLRNARLEFAIFALIGGGGLLLNQLVIYLGVDRLGLTPEVAKLLSAGISFLFNYAARKTLLFTVSRNSPHSAPWPVRES